MYSVSTAKETPTLHFLFAVGISQLVPIVRLSAEVGAVFYCIHYSQRELVLFFVGLLVAEVHLSLGGCLRGQYHLPLVERCQPRDMEAPTHVGQSYRFRLMLILLFILGFFLIGMSFRLPEASPGYSFFIAINGSSYFWQCVGSTLLIIKSPLSPDLAPIFNNRLARYLGRISYSLYIVHLNVKRVVTYSTMPGVWRLVDRRESQPGYAIGILIAISLLLSGWPMFGGEGLMSPVFALQDGLR